MPSFPGVLLFWKHSKSKAQSSQVILLSHDIFCSSESFGSDKSFKKDSIASLIFHLLALMLFDMISFIKIQKIIRTLIFSPCLSHRALRDNYLTFLSP